MCMQMFRARERRRGRERARQVREAQRRQQLQQGTAMMERMSTLAAGAPAEEAGVVLGAVVATLSDEEVLALELARRCQAARRPGAQHPRPSHSIEEHQAVSALGLMRGPAAPRPGLPAAACPVDAAECVAGVSGDDAEEGLVEEQEGCQVSEREGGGRLTETAGPKRGWMLSNKRLEHLLAQVSALEAADDPAQLSLFLSGLSEVDRWRLAAALGSTHQPQRPPVQPDIQEHQAVSALQSSLHHPRGLGLYQADPPPAAATASMRQPSCTSIQLEAHEAAADPPEAAALCPSARPMSRPPPLPLSLAAVTSPRADPQRGSRLGIDQRGADQVLPAASPPAAAASNSLEQALRRIAVQIDRQKASLDRLGVSCTPPGEMPPGERDSKSKMDAHAGVIAHGTSSLRMAAGALAEQGQADVQDHPTLKAIKTQAERGQDGDLHGGISDEARSRPPDSGGGAGGHEPDEPSPVHVGPVQTPPTSHGPPATSDAPAPRQRQTPPPQVRALSLSGVSLVPVRPSPPTPHLNMQYTYMHMMYACSAFRCAPALPSDPPTALHAYMYNNAY